ncbi:CRIB domain-containing protein RIC10-like [Rhododendron vialii]|uniref:CRIB domain-containing protein RIC10-like n=1 Tax=Rhododendron vialii TaxID=182163 RepID=UPI00265DC945|nr:CRIB domain-containing protein RIC10-like [Rhododendron vialii]
MATKIKGIYKGFKYISQIFVVTKEREIEIGYPTDVKHVAHIGWDGPSGTAPTWMNEINTASNFAATSISNINETRGSSSAVSTWSSQDYESMDRQPMSDQMLKDAPPPTGIPKIPKKQKRKKTKSTSSPKSSSSSSRSSRAAKSKTKFVESNAKTSNIEVM